MHFISAAVCRDLCLRCIRFGKANPELETEMINSLCTHLRVFVLTVTPRKRRFVLLSRHGAGLTTYQRTLQNPIRMANAKEPTRGHIPAANVDASRTFFPFSWLHSMDSTWSGGGRCYDSEATRQHTTRTGSLRLFNSISKGSTRIQHDLLLHEGWSPSTFLSCTINSLT